MKGLFVTGTDTDVGKTWISQGLMRCLARSGKRVVGMKPVASGCHQTDNGLRSDDALMLQQAATEAVEYELVNLYSFAPAIAPETAAERVGVSIDPERILECFDRLTASADAVVVEGVGGWRVPLNGRYDVAMMAQQLALPVVIVVNIRLGCVNHARLTEESILNAGLPVLGWVANNKDAATIDHQTVEAIDKLLEASCIGVVPKLASTDRVSDFLTLR
jgi:dethiobiotin synthetase